MPPRQRRPQHPGTVCPSLVRQPLVARHIAAPASSVPPTDGQATRLAPALSAPPACGCATLHTRSPRLPVTPADAPNDRHARLVRPSKGRSSLRRPSVLRTSLTPSIRLALSVAFDAESISRHFLPVSSITSMSSPSHFVLPITPPCI